MKYHLVTLGCAKNTVDSMRLEHALRTGRHIGVDAPEDADLLVVNTCGFIDAAKDESVDVVRQLDAMRRPDQKLYVVGCMTQIAEDEVRAAVPNIDATFGVEQWEQPLELSGIDVGEEVHVRAATAELLQRIDDERWAQP